MKILMVCLGNICRSPIAHGILEHKILENELDWKVDSAGTAGYHEGERPDRRSIATAKEHGINIIEQRSRKVQLDDLNNFDLILAMDASNYNHLVKMAINESQKEKIKMILNYSYPGENRQVPDPYYKGGFEGVFDLLNHAVDKLIEAES